MMIYHAMIIPRPGTGEILLLPVDEGWALPGFGSETWEAWSAGEHLNRWLRKQWGLRATTLYCLTLKHYPEEGYYRLVYSMDNHDPAWEPPAGGRWVDHASLVETPLPRPNEREAVEAWFARGEAPPSPWRVPWFEEGWWDTAEAWVAAQTARAGRRAVGPLEQVRSWQRSTVLRQRTDQGTVYFKAVPPMFGHELALAALLEERHPQHVPPLLAADAARRWMLLDGVEGPMLEQLPDLPAWEEALNTYARIQLDLADQPERLLALGCPDRRLPTVIAEMDALLADEEALITPRPGGLKREEVEMLRSLAPELHAHAANLDEIGLSYTLEHGDLWAMQIIRSADGPVFLDWSDSSLSHPFFSMSFFYEMDDYFYTHVEAGKVLAAIPGARERLIAAYLEPWTRYAPMATLRRALDLAETLVGVHLALLYHRIILPQMEFAWEMHNMIPHHLRKVLKWHGVVG